MKIFHIAENKVIVILNIMFASYFVIFMLFSIVTGSNNDIQNNSNYLKNRFSMFDSSSRVEIDNTNISYNVSGAFEIK
ncbi:MAG: hypothetical protein AB1782_16135 [Cyanobacteriota bacterium]